LGGYVLTKSLAKDLVGKTVTIVMKWRP